MQYSCKNTNFAGFDLVSGIPMAGWNSSTHSAYIQGGLKNTSSLVSLKMSIFNR